MRSSRWKLASKTAAASASLNNLKAHPERVQLLVGNTDLTRGYDFRLAGSIRNDEACASRKKGLRADLALDLTHLVPRARVEEHDRALVADVAPQRADGEPGRGVLVLHGQRGRVDVEHGRRERLADEVSVNGLEKLGCPVDLVAH